MGLIGDVEIHTLEGVAGNLRPDAVLLHRNLMHLYVIDFELAGLLVHPKIDVVILVGAAGLRKSVQAKYSPSFFR